MRGPCVWSMLHVQLGSTDGFAVLQCCRVVVTVAGGCDTHWCCVLAVLVSNFLDSFVAHEVGGLVSPVLQGCAVWSSQRRVCGQVNVLHLQTSSQP